MYASQYKNNQKCTSSSGIPVENFDPGPGLSNYARRAEAETRNCTADCQNSSTQEPCDTTMTQQCDNLQENKPCTCVQSCSSPQKKVRFGLETDDLLLIFLIFLLISDTEQDNDVLIPILLAVLLIF